MSDKIDLIVGKEALAGLDALISKLGSAHEAILKMSQESRDINKTVGGIKTPSGLNNQITANANLTAELGKQTQVAVKAQQQIEKLSIAREKATAKALLNAEKERIAQINLDKAREKSIDSYTKAEVKAQQVLERSENIYNKVQAKVNGLTATYNNLATKQALGLSLNLKEQSQLGSLTGRLEKYQNVLKTVDGNIGKYQRNVGNYASGFNPLSNAIGQISRELPNFGQSLQIGIMSLTNNIGALQDAVKGIVAQNRILEAEGKATRSVMSQIGSSILSFNTGLYIGIALLSAYGKEIGDWASALFDGSDALKELTANQKAFLEAKFQGRKDAVSEIIELKKYLAVVKNEKVSMEERGIALKALRDQFPFYFKNLTDAQILAGKSTEAEKALTIALEKRKEVEKKSEITVKNEQKLKDLERELDATNALEKAQKKQLDIERAKPKIMDRGAAQAQRTQELKAEDSYNSTLEKRIQIQKDIKLVTEETVKNETAIFQLKTETIALEYQEDKSHKKKKKKLKEFNQEYVDFLANEYALRHQQMSDVISTNKEIADDEAISFDKRTIARSVFYNESIKLAELEKAEQLRLLENATASEVAEVEKNYSEKKITVQEKNKAIYAIEQQTLFDRQLIYQNFGTEFAKITKEYGKNIDELIDHVANKKDDLYLLDTKQLAGLKLYADALKKVAETAGVSDIGEKNGVEIGKFKDLEDMKLALRKNRSKEETEIDLRDIQRKMAVFAVEHHNSTEYQDLLKKELELKTALVNIEVETAEKAEQAAKKKIQDMKSYLRSFQDEFANNSGFKTLFDALNGQITGFGENWAVTANAMMEVGQELFALLNQQSEARYQAEMTRLASQRDISIQFAGESTTARTEIERQYEERRRNLERKKAEEAKKVALFNAIIDTAQAVVGALAEQNYAGAVLYGLIGAAQIAMISSQPIPAFAEGGIHDGGTMLVNDAKGSNYRETIVTPDGKISQPTGRNVLMNAPKGTEIYTPEQWQRQLDGLLMSNGILPMGTKLPVTQNANGMTMQQMETAMTNAIRKMPVSDGVSINIDENGFMKRVTSGSQTREILNSRLRTKGRNV